MVKISFIVSKEIHELFTIASGPFSVAFKGGAKVSYAPKRTEASGWICTQRQYPANDRLGIPAMTVNPINRYYAK